MGEVWYTTREKAKRALDVAETARNNTQVDAAIAASSRMIDGGKHIGGLLKRRFYPETGTRYFDWPNRHSPTPWRLWLDQLDMISATTVTAGGVTIAATDYFLRPDDGPPYDHIEIDLASNAAFAAASGTHQRAIAITGVWGYTDDETSVGATIEALDASETGVDVSAAASATVGVGNIIRVDSERMIVTGRSMLDTGQNLTSTSLTASAGNVTVTVADGTAFAIDETILLDSERMLIVDIAGNNLTVKRAYDGSVLAAHTHTTTDIYAPRTLTVTRGALGTTAATHSSAAIMTRHDVPALVDELCLAQTLVNLGLRGSGYADTEGAGETSRRVAAGRGLAAIRRDAIAAYGRVLRMRAV
jgi:hypothetical protein